MYTLLNELYNHPEDDTIDEKLASMKKMKDQHKKGVKQIVLFIGCAISIANDLGLDNLSNNVNELFGKTSLVQFVFAFLTQLKTCGDLSNIIDCDYIKNKTNNENLPIVYSLDTFLRYGVSAFYTSLYKNENFKCNVQYNCDEQVQVINNKSK